MDKVSVETSTRVVITRITIKSVQFGEHLLVLYVGL